MDHITPAPVPAPVSATAPAPARAPVGITFSDQRRETAFQTVMHADGPSHRELKELAATLCDQLLASGTAGGPIDLSHRAIRGLPGVSELLTKVRARCDALEK
jgi:hypothetical protein